MEVFKKELIKMREEKHITEMKSKQVEQNLRSDIEELRRNLERELQIHTSKCNNLEAALSRKNKEIADKDGFIKRFLLGRIK